MSILDDAINNAMATYAGCAGQQYEFGWLLWRDSKTQQIVVGQRVNSPNTNSVNLYPVPTRLEIVTQHCKTKQKLFVGEFHAHPRGQGTWAGQLPSPHDIVNANISVAGSLWPLQPPINGVDSVGISPEFQIIQSLQYGDLIILKRGPAWQPFPSLQYQQTELDRILAGYSAWHWQADRRLGIISQTDHESFFAQWSREVAAIGQVLGPRFAVTARQNHVNKP